MRCTYIVYVEPEKQHWCGKLCMNRCTNRNKVSWTRTPDTSGHNFLVYFIYFFLLFFLVFSVLKKNICSLRLFFLKVLFSVSTEAVSLDWGSISYAGLQTLLYRFVLPVLCYFHLVLLRWLLLYNLLLKTHYTLPEIRPVVKKKKKRSLIYFQVSSYHTKYVSKYPTHESHEASGHLKKGGG